MKAFIAALMTYVCVSSVSLVALGVSACDVQAQGVLLDMNGGGAHTVLVKTDKTVWTWGANDKGQLGVAALQKTFEPVQVTLPTVRKVAAGQFFTLALTWDRAKIYAFGDNSSGALGINDDTIESSSTPMPVVLSLPSRVTILDVVDGGNHAFALLSNGTVYGWGKNDKGQVGVNPLLELIVHKPVLVKNLTGVISLAAGDHHTLALKSDGTVWAWGSNRYGQLGPSPTPGPRVYAFVPKKVVGLANIVLIATGGEHSLAADSSGTLFSWGRNLKGQLGLGTIDNMDGPHPTPQWIKSLQNIREIDGEGPTSLAVDGDGNIYTFGSNTYGQIGDGTRVDRPTPVKVHRLTSLLGFVRVAAGHFSSVAYTKEGVASAWGRNEAGELALPIGPPVLTPQDITDEITPIQ